jgi:hypothetical protein
MNGWTLVDVRAWARAAHSQPNYSIGERWKRKWKSTIIISSRPLHDPEAHKLIMNSTQCKGEKEREEENPSLALFRAALRAPFLPRLRAPPPGRKALLCTHL